MEERSLDYTDRKIEYGRKTLPCTRNTQSNVAKDGAQWEDLDKDFTKLSKASQDLIKRVVATMRGKVDETLNSMDGISNWTLQPEHRLSAEIGQVLFPLEKAGSKASTETTIAKASGTPFLTSFPGLSSLLTSAGFRATARLQTPSLIYEFLPDPEQPNFKAGQTFPSLHIQMRAGYNGGKAFFHKLSLGFPAHFHDVLLPDKSADLRFTQYGRLRLMKNHKDKNVQKWVEAVVANIESGERLTAPPLQLEIPKWTIPGTPSDATGTRTVTYLFSGIQFRQSVSGHLLDADVSFSTIQSGKLGPKGGVLSAHYSANSKEGDDYLRDDVALRGFVKRCLGIVDKITAAAAQTMPLTSILKLRDGNSDRKLRRQAQQATALAASEDGTPQASKEEKATEAVISPSNVEEVNPQPNVEIVASKQEAPKTLESKSKPVGAAPTTDAFSAHGFPLQDTMSQKSESKPGGKKALKAT